MYLNKQGASNMFNRIKINAKFKSFIYVFTIIFCIIFSSSTIIYSQDDCHTLFKYIASLGDDEPTYFRLGISDKHIYKIIFDCWHETYQIYRTIKEYSSIPNNEWIEDNIPDKEWVYQSENSGEYKLYKYTTDQDGSGICVIEINGISFIVSISSDEFHLVAINPDYNSIHSDELHKRYLSILNE